ncbi:MAG TPA: phosphoribosyl-AMP cyclohydrolase [Actinomycetota bacterium]|nr:phosphoribosyl-AMP cyclohydrolase [Actinomycetota bacterium]
MTSPNQDADLSIADLSFDDRGLLPAIVQEAATGDVLMLGWMNEESIRATFSKGLATFWSRSRRELWTKGETSGNKLRLVDVRYDCDADALLVRVHLEGDGACHTGNRSCFYRTLDA